MSSDRPVKVAIVGGGCASIAAAFELTRAHHHGKYQVTVYQLGWRLGGKGASGRGPGGRIEEHGLHIWLGFYENAFRLMRECYAELHRDPLVCPIADWRDAFFPDPHVGVADQAKSGVWREWLAYLPPAPGLPGDPIATPNPFTVRGYLARAVVLLRAMLFSTRTREMEPASTDLDPWDQPPEAAPPISVQTLIERASRLVQLGMLSTAAGLSEALGLIGVALRMLPVLPEALATSWIETVAAKLREWLETMVERDEHVRRKWEIVDLVLAFLVGAVRFRLLTDPRGLSVLDVYDCRDFLRMNGASERSLNSAFVRGLYDLALAYEDGDPARPGIAAGQGFRNVMRMFFTYRGAIFWKMRAGMGDCVFAPFYETLKRRGVRFEFFHRLENVRLASPDKTASGQRPYVEALEFDVQAEIVGGGEYQPLIDVKGVPCWPSSPDFAQLTDGAGLEQEGRRFESHWDKRKVATKTLSVTQDFDFVVLGVSVGAIPFVCKEIVARDARWRQMVANVKTVATQSFQVWMNEEMSTLGWTEAPLTLSAFTKPFDTWADMTHVAPEEAWRELPKSIAYFCNVLGDADATLPVGDPGHETVRREEVRRNAVTFLNREVHHLWPHAAEAPGQFRWSLLMDAREPLSPGETPLQGEARFASQYWTANVNPTDRYVLMLPGSLRHRISPLDNTYDNLTIAGDWTDCGHNAGCVEAAIMSGRLAAHAISLSPPLEDIVGFDHP